MAWHRHPKAMAALVKAGQRLGAIAKARTTTMATMAAGIRGGGRAAVGCRVSSSCFPVSSFSSLSFPRQPRHYKRNLALISVGMSLVAASSALHEDTPEDAAFKASFAEGASHLSFESCHPAVAPPHPNVAGKPRLVILGSGWGAVSVLKGLDTDAFDVIVISPRNYFLFTPLLPSATTGTLESRSLVEPIRRLCYLAHARYFESRATDLDFDTREVICKSEDGKIFRVPYDELIVAIGAKNNTFNIPGVKEYAHFLKEVKHARRIRARILQNFERAELPCVSAAERARLLHFVIVGGGPTGVEFAAELHDFLQQDAIKQYPTLAGQVKISLLQSGDHILNTYDLAISDYAEQQFKKQAIHVILGARVKEVKEDGVVYIDKVTNETVTVPFGLCVWSTGIDTMSFTKKLIAKLSDTQNNKRCLVTDSRLRVLGRETLGRVYAIGDCATPSLPQLVAKAENIFELADANGDGSISLEEFTDLCNVASEEIPVMASHFKKPEKLFRKYTQYGVEPTARVGAADSVASGPGVLNLEQFKAFLKDAESSLKAYPATAQVASQQGDYLAKRFNSMNRALHQANLHRTHSAYPGGSDCPATLEQLMPPEQNKPFVYHHFGSLAYVGSESAAIDLGERGALSGFIAFWLWKSVYLSKQVSMRTRLALAFDWFKSYCFGRDTSQYG